MSPEFDVKTAIVRCEPSGREVHVLQDSKLMDAIIQSGLGLGQSCEGVALCGFCRVRVVEGAENLTPMASEEENILNAQDAGENQRLACCAKILGPVSVTTDYW